MVNAPTLEALIDLVYSHSTASYLGTRDGRDSYQAEVPLIWLSQDYIREMHSVKRNML